MLDTNVGGGTPKILEPGNQIVKINSLELMTPPWKGGENDYHVLLHCEGEDQGDSFEGFYIDKDDTSQGRYAGQVGRIQASQWPYNTVTLKSGVEIDRDKEIMKFIKNLCTALGQDEWMTSQNGKHETIESLVNQFNDDRLSQDRWLRVCISGKEYRNKEGYINYNLFFPKWNKIEGAAFESADISEDSTAVQKFNKSTHILSLAKPADEVDDNFGSSDEVEDDSTFTLEEESK